MLKCSLGKIFATFHASPVRPQWQRGELQHRGEHKARRQQQLRLWNAARGKSLSPQKLTPNWSWDGEGVCNLCQFRGFLRPSGKSSAWSTSSWRQEFSHQKPGDWAKAKGEAHNVDLRRGGATAAARSSRKIPWERQEGLQGRLKQSGSGSQAGQGWQSSQHRRTATAPGQQSLVWVALDLTFHYGYVSTLLFFLNSFSKIFAWSLHYHNWFWL